jgi:tripartite-type tricarboxylate transporter receptor subunit TctC
LTRDFAPVSLLTTGHYMLVTHPSVPARSVKELLAIARAKPGGLTYGSAGTGNATHLAAEWMNILGQVKTLHVAYKGAGPARTDLLGGQIDFMFHNITAVLRDVESKRLRGLAVTGPGRALVAPQVPTMAESGLTGYDITSWFGVAAPSGTPPEVLARLNKELVRVMGLAEIKQPLGGLGSEAVGSSAKVFGDHLRAELDKWQRVVKQAGIRAE